MEMEKKSNSKKTKEVVVLRDVTVVRDGVSERVSCKLSYNKCQLFYNPDTSTFVTAPWNETLGRYEQSLAGGFTKLSGAAQSVKEIQKFTDMVDALKLLLGKEVFTRVRVEGLWYAFLGNHDEFWFRYRQYF